MKGDVHTCVEPSSGDAGWCYGPGFSPCSSLRASGVQVDSFSQNFTETPDHFMWLKLEILFLSVLK